MLRGTKNRQCVLCLRNVGGPLVTPYNRPIKIRDSFEAFGISIFHFPFFSSASDISRPTLGLSIRDSSGQHLFKLRKSLLPGQCRAGEEAV